jgi:hypothetical protein
MSLSLKWSDGTVIERSPRMSRPSESDAVAASVFTDPKVPPVNINSVLNENKAYLQSLEVEGFREVNKREESWEKMSSRELVGQIGVNPFFSSSSSSSSMSQQDIYVNDIAMRDQFMKPISTNMDKVKFADE